MILNGIISLWRSALTGLKAWRGRTRKNKGNAMSSERQKPVKKSARASDQQRVLNDAGAWVASLRSDVASMLDGFRRQHMERASSRDSEVLEHISNWVRTLRLDVGELIPRLREERLRGAASDAAGREETVSGIADWVDAHAEATRDHLQKTGAEMRDENEASAEVRRELISSLEAWGEDFRQRIAELTREIQHGRESAAGEGQETRRAFIERMKTDIGGLLPDLRSARTEAAEAFAGQLRDGMEEIARWSDSMRQGVAELTETLREERLSRAKEDAAARREYIERLRREVAEMRRGVRSAEPRVSPRPLATPARKAPAATPAPVTTPSWTRPVLAEGEAQPGPRPRRAKATKRGGKR